MVSILSSATSDTADFFFRLLFAVKVKYITALTFFVNTKHLKLKPLTTCHKEYLQQIDSRLDSKPCRKHLYASTSLYCYGFLSSAISLESTFQIRLKEMSKIPYLLWKRYNETSIIIVEK
ncbi:unnamed protein product [Albugo candida]|uniref:Uncharacterized protein n=1 Tax=Albugo candida TaxID=65357 RepID=A0A024GRF7_9STRA|nr:unnamed protein product [Albugo candida]|eukprot:CCI49320.1 unnamed protein product [Albugo candida]